MTDEKKEAKDLTLGERAVNWAKALSIILPLIGTSVVGTLAYFKGNSAENGVDSIIKQLDQRVAKQEKVINIQSDRLEKMARRLIFFQAHQEGMTAGKLQAKVDELEHELADLKAKKLSRSERTKKLTELIKAVQKAEDKPPPAPAPPQADQVQTIPRLKPKAFLRKGD